MAPLAMNKYDKKYPVQGAYEFFATSRLVTRFGMPLTLALMPIVMCVALTETLSSPK
ncbi:MAG: hypothetical protein WD772_00400 [Pseudohongiellaceae bacterium]